MINTRTYRWKKLLEEFPDFEKYRVLDLGGLPSTWLNEAPVKPAQVTVVNLVSMRTDLPDWIRTEQADATQIGWVLGEFDFVYCNSVIEHVGGHQKRLELADSILLSTGNYWVQTPYRYFPIEPHWRFPAFQFLPVSTRAAVSRHWPLTNYRGQSKGTSRETVLGVELLSVSEMRHYFPSADIRLGVKSIVAVGKES